ncbi:class E sortase, partial [Streptomyces sparsogenes]|uniref:class E sortase n=1 Tax=Streptomyces sparsogenes TaxID=67365 RepID=UPI0033E3B0C5
GTGRTGTDGIGTARRRPAGSGPAGSGPNGGEAGGAADPQGPPTGGRAARRRAAQAAARRGGRRAARGGADGGTQDATAAGGGARTAPAAPRTRMEAKRAARARKDSPAVIVSRVVGELFITVGVLMLLFVTYQLWWTNIRAHQQANGAANSLQKKWDRDGGKRDPGTFSPGEGFAILYIPKLDVKAPIAEGISKQGVLDHGMVGHYGKGTLKTAMPWDKKGNFALAGHRNTHGEPFRYINHLEPGDKIVVETQNAFFTYEMTSILPQTSPSNTGVIGPVPPGSGFTKPGRYITLTTCTPEFTSKYRMIVWGKMVDERPRSEGKPDALVQ